MNRVFYIFRHGETDWNREWRYQGHVDIPLNASGVTQAHDLAHRLSDIPLDVVMSSDLKRALETGKIVAQQKSIPLLIDSDLREMSYGVAEGKLYTEVEELLGPEFLEQWKSFGPVNEALGFPDGEKRGEARARFLRALEKIMATTTYNSIGISTHGGILRNVLHSFLAPDHPTIPIPNCVVYKLTYHFDRKHFSVDLKPL